MPEDKVYSGIGYYASDHIYLDGEIIRPKLLVGMSSRMAADIEFDMKAPEGKPKRRNAVFLTKNIDDARFWQREMQIVERKLFHVYRVRFKGNIHIGDSWWVNEMMEVMNKMVETLPHEQNKRIVLENDIERIARGYWSGEPSGHWGAKPLWEIVLDGEAEVLEILEN